MPCLQEDTVWACLAGFATSAKELETAEIAYAAIDEADKVRYIQYIKVKYDCTKKIENKVSNFLIHK